MAFIELAEGEKLINISFYIILIILSGEVNIDKNDNFVVVNI